MKRGLDAYAKAGAWVGLFRLQLDFRTQISQKAINKKNGFETYFECISHLSGFKH